MAEWPSRAPKVGDVATMTRAVSPDDIVRFTEMSVIDAKGMFRR